MNSFSTARFLGAFSAAALMGVSLCACGGGVDASAGGAGGSGGTGGSAGDGGGGSACAAYDPASSERGLEYAAAVCGYLAECCTPEDIAETYGDIDYADCRIALRSFWETGIEMSTRQLEAAGALEFDEAAFHGCMESLVTRPCADLHPLEPWTFCADVWIPKVQPGGACTSSLQCTTRRCEVPIGEPSGTCVAPVGLDGDCDGHDECDDQLHCASGKCAPAKPDGQDCNSSDECQSQRCIGDWGIGQCSTICQGGGLGPGPIEEALEELVGPLIWADCSKRSVCCEGACSSGDALANCLAGNAIFSPDFGFFEIHRLKKEGKLTVDGEALRSCVDAYAAQSCTDYAKAPGFSCPAAYLGLVQDGQPCSHDEMCTSKYCNQPMPGQFGTCDTLAGAGAPCNGQCVPGYHCDGQTCVPQKPLGEACTSTLECAEGSCAGPEGGPLACTLVCTGK